MNFRCHRHRIATHSHPLPTLGGIVFFFGWVNALLSDSSAILPLSPLANIFMVSPNVSHFSGTVDDLPFGIAAFSKGSNNIHDSQLQ